MDWTILLNTTYGALFRPPDDAMLLRQGIYKLTQNQYVYVFDDAIMGICFSGFAWVAGDQAARVLLHRDGHAEPEATSPPPQVLPNLQPLTFQNIVLYGQTEFPDSFRLWTPLTTVVAFADYSIHFRDAWPSELAFPIAIEVERDPLMHIPLE